MKLCLSILFLFVTKATCYYSVCNCTLKIEESEKLMEHLQKLDLLQLQQKTSTKSNTGNNQAYGMSLKKDVEDINMSVEVITEATAEIPKNPVQHKITKIDLLIDAFTSNLTYTVTKNEFKPIRIPNFHKEYKNTRSPNVQIHIVDGYLKFNSKINRVGSSTIALNQKELVLSTPLVLKNFDVKSQYAIEVLNAECKGNISAEIEDLNFSLMLGINLKNSEISIQTIKLTNMRKIEIVLKGNVIKRYRKLVDEQYKKVVYYVAEHTIFGYIREELQKFLATYNFGAPPSILL